MTAIQLDPHLAIRIEELKKSLNGSIEIEVQEAANEAIQRLLDQLVIRKLEQEQRAFEAQHSQLVEKFLGRFVAFHQGQLVDVDDDQHNLYVRVQQAYPNAAVGIFPVTESAEMPALRSTGVRFSPSGRAQQ
jgi:hypothetical protein